MKFELRLFSLTSIGYYLIAFGLLKMIIDTVKDDMKLLSFLLSLFLVIVVIIIVNRIFFKQIIISSNSTIIKDIFHKKQYDNKYIEVQHKKTAGKVFWTQKITISFPDKVINCNEYRIKYEKFVNFIEENSINANITKNSQYVNL